MNDLCTNLQNLVVKTAVVEGRGFITRGGYQARELLFEMMAEMR